VNMYLMSMIQPDPTGKKVKQSIYRVPYPYSPHAGPCLTFYLCRRQFQYLYGVTDSRLTRLNKISRMRGPAFEGESYRWSNFGDRMKSQYVFGATKKKNNTPYCAYFCVDTKYKPFPIPHGVVRAAVAPDGRGGFRPAGIVTDVGVAK